MSPSHNTCHVWRRQLQKNPGGVWLPPARRPIDRPPLPGVQLTGVIFVSATPADYELEKSEGIVVDQLIA